MLTKKLLVKKFNLIVSSFFIFILHLPFVFARSIPRSIKNLPKKTVATIVLPITDSVFNPINKLVQDSLRLLSDSTSNIYNELKLSTLGLSKQVFDYSLQGLHKMASTGKLINSKIVSIVDFSQPSASKRLYIIDLEKKEVLFNTYVAHGKNSGQEMATQFSNQPTSNKSSLGFYITSHTYNGKNGFSLQLQGQEAGINDKAFERGIVMHAADYVNESYIQSQGWIGRSQGCPAVMPDVNKPIVETIKEGSCFFIYYPDEAYLHKSVMLN